MSEDINVGGVLEALNGKVDVDLGNCPIVANTDASNFTTTGKETVVGWGMPDYSAGVAKTVSTTNQTVDSFGLLEVRMQFTSGTHKFYINDIEKTLQSGNGGIITHWLFYNVSPNDTFRFSSTNSGFSVMFYPLKGVN